MNREKLLTMDPYIALSWANMKLRDEFDDLRELCYGYDLEIDDIKKKMEVIGYKYNEGNNQFVTV